MTWKNEEGYEVAVGHGEDDRQRSPVERGVIKLDPEQEERIFKIQISSFKEASKLIFMWVKAGDINVKQFIQLNEANREAL